MQNNETSQQVWKKQKIADGFHITCRLCLNERGRRNRKRLAERSSIALPKTQRCLGPCGKTLPSTEFFRQCNRRNGLTRMCRSCCATQAQYYRKLYISMDVVSFKLRSMVNQARTRAKKEGVPFDIDVNWLIDTFGQVTHCPILDIELNWNVPRKPAPNSPSLDKKIPELGYVKGNVWIISHRANYMKNDAGLDLLRKFGLWAIEFTTIASQKSS